MEQVNHFIETLNGYLFSQYTIYALLFTGLLFTIWSGFGQFRALTHGVAVVRGKYDDKDDPGAINHFQALSAALSATVGLGNIAGVALAVALGGPGAIFWMWIIGILGMALKMTEVTQSMLYRNTDDPDNPHGGPMFVVKKGFAKWGLGPIGSIIGGIFVITLLLSAFTGGNMFQAWNVADITHTYFGTSQVTTGIILTVVVGLVIIGGIKRIGSVAGKIVPFMCISYVLAAFYVLFMNLGTIPEMFGLIFQSAFAPAEASGAFLGGTVGYAAMWGIKRALFSSEAGQGSSPIAHSAAKTDEPVREGVVAGLEPFIDTIVVCTLTALVILSSGAYNREPEAQVVSAEDAVVYFASDQAGTLAPVSTSQVEDRSLVWSPVALPDRIPTATEVEAQEKKNKPLPDWKKGDAVFSYGIVSPGGQKVPVSGKVKKGLFPDGSLGIAFDPVEWEEGETPIQSVTLETTLYHKGSPQWNIRTLVLPPMTAEAKRIRQTPEGQSGWRDGETVFMVVVGDQSKDTGLRLKRLTGTIKRDIENDTWSVKWKRLEAKEQPVLRTLEDDSVDLGIYGDYAGASLTAYAFDRVTPGLGKILVTFAAWLFAVSTMISWSYYGEQGVYYLFGFLGKKSIRPIVMVYKLIYCLLILFTCIAATPLITGADGEKHPIIGTDSELDMWTTLGLGVMLVANIPIMLIFGSQAMKAYHAYFKKMAAGGDPPHDAPPFEDVIEGKDVE
jgi:amino acid carrier protein